MITSIITKSKSGPLLNQRYIYLNHSTTIFTFSTLYAIIYIQKYSQGYMNEKHTDGKKGVRFTTSLSQLWSVTLT